MKVGILYGLLVIINLTLVSTKLKDQEQFHDATSSSQLIDTNSSNVCAVILVNPSLEKCTFILNPFRLVNTKLVEDSYNQKTRLLFATKHQNRAQVFDTRPVKRALLAMLFRTTQEEDTHHLS